MNHNVDGRKFGRNTSHRAAMFRNMANSVISKEQIITTVQKAKETRRVVDRLITLGKTDSLHSRRLAFDRTRDRDVVVKLFSTLAERYKTRAGGYTRVLKMDDRRWGDAAEMAVLMLVDADAKVLDRKRKPKAPGTDAAVGGNEAKNAADPLKGFKRMFGAGRGGKKGGGDAVGASTKAKGGRAKSSAGRKSPAGGGSSKQGGSSS